MIYIIGTSHKYQVRTCAIMAEHSLDCTKAASLNFEEMIARSISQYDVSAIAEEAEANLPIFECEGAFSIARQLADSRELTHVFCEPNAEERGRLGIATAEQREADAGNGFIVREHAWLEKLRPVLNYSSILLICGADHIPTFTEKLRVRQIGYEVIHFDWRAD